MKEKNRKTQLIAYTLWIAILVSMVGFGLKAVRESSPISFNATVWRAPRTQLQQRKQRARMVQDLMHRYLKKDLHEMQIRFLLGAPYRTTVFSGDVPNTPKFVYLYEMPHPWFGQWKLRYLRVDFNIQYRVTKIEIYKAP